LNIVNPNINLNNTNDDKLNFTIKDRLNNEELIDYMDDIVTIKDKRI
jgi:hypothetical protein